MNPPFRLLGIALLAICLIGLPALLQLRDRSEKDPQNVDVSSNSQDQTSKSGAQFFKKTEGHPDVADRLPIENSNVASSGIDDFLTERDSSDGFESGPAAIPIKRVLASYWMNEKSADGWRDRVRVVEADFKYPFLRVEERVRAVDPIENDQHTSANETLASLARRDGEELEIFTISIADHVILPLKVGQAGEVERFLRKDEQLQIRMIEEDSFVLLEVPEPTRLDAFEAVQNELNRYDELIDPAEPDYLVFPTTSPNDPEFQSGRLWAFDNSRDFDFWSFYNQLPSDIDAVRGWAIRTRANGVKVAVTDTGLQYRHEDLDDNLWIDPTTGFAGYDFYDDDPDPNEGAYGHGTHVAGTIGAEGNNGVGVVGVAWEVQLMGVRFMNPRGGANSDAIRAINYSRLNGAEVINASWGSGGRSTALYNAIKACHEAGIIFVASAGNVPQNNDARPHYPSSYDLPNIVAVAASNLADRPSTFTSWGKESVDLFAPGTEIYSCGGLNTTQNEYRFSSGTSMAAPFVSGALALARAEFPSESHLELISRLYASVDQIPALESLVSSGGRLNLYRLLTSQSPSPRNDDFENAYLVTGDSAAWVGHNIGATKESDETSWTGLDSGVRSLWFQWTVPRDGIATFSATGFGPEITVAAFRGESKSDLRSVGSPVLLNETGKSFINLRVTAGQSYWFVVDSHEAGGHSLDCSFRLLPENDMVREATLIQGRTFQVKGNNQTATTEPFEVISPIGGSGGGASIWWKWNADFTGQMIVSSAGSDFDTVIAAYRGEPDQLIEIASNDDAGKFDDSSQIEISVTQGESYYFGVDRYGNEGGGEVTLRGFQSDGILIVSSPESVITEIGGRVEFEVIALSGLPLRYQWKLNGTPIIGARESRLILPSVTTESFGEITLTISNSKTSLDTEPILLSERRSAPRVVWSSGDLAVLEGENSGLRVVAQGSEPMTFSWQKNGTPLPGITAGVVQLNNVGADDEGSYSCKIENSEGSITVQLKVSMVSSSIAGIEWSAPGYRGAEVVDLEIFGDRIFAVDTGAVRYSNDGENWTRIPLPGNFKGSWVAMRNGVLYCFGLNFVGAGVYVTTEDFEVWSPVQLVDRPNTNLSHLKFAELSSTSGGRFVSLKAENDNNAIAYSNDALNWQEARVSLNGGASYQAFSDLSGDRNGLIKNPDPHYSGPRFYRFPGMMLLVDAQAIYRSTDGISWIRVSQLDRGSSTQGNEAPSFYDLEGQFAVGLGRRMYRSPDGGLSWQVQDLSYDTPSYCDGFIFDGGIVHLNRGGRHLSVGTRFQRFYWSEALDRKPAILQANSDKETSIKVAKKFQGAIIYGTDTGVLGKMAFLGDGVENHNLGDAWIHSSSIPKPTSIGYAGNEFFRFAGGNQIWVSGDGFNWRPVNQTGEKHHSSWLLPKIRLNDGRFCNAVGYGYSGGGYVEKWDYQSPANFPALDSYATDGQTIVFQRGSDLLWMPASGGTLTQVPSNPAVGLGQGSIYYLEETGKWYRPGTRPMISTNGKSWTNYETSDRQGYFAEINGTALFLSRDNGRGSISTDGGESWESITTPFHHLNATSSVNIRQLISYDNTFLVLIHPTHHLEKKSAVVMASNDGRTWALAPMPDDIDSFCVGGEVLLATTYHGGVVRAGPKNGAPLIEMSGALNGSKVMIGSFMTFSAKVNDPEGATVSTEVRMNGEIIRQETAEEFEVKLPADREGDYVFTMRSVDADGFVSSYEWAVEIVTPAPDSVFQSLISPSQAQVENWVSYEGEIFASSQGKLYRSSNAMDWTHVELPGLRYGLRHIISGNGVILIVGMDQSLIRSIDGINWSLLPEKSWNQTLSFEKGRFWDGGTRSSEDGIAWDEPLQGIPYETIDSQRVLLTPGGEIMKEPLQLERPFTRTVGGGRFWATIDLFRGHQSAVALQGTTMIAYGVGRADQSANAGRVMYSDDDGWTWQTVEDLPVERFSKVQGFHHVLDRLYLTVALGAEDLNASVTYWTGDGIAWHKAIGPIPGKDDPAFSLPGGILSQNEDGLLTSLDGIVWQEATNRPPVPPGAGLLQTDEAFFYHGRDGSVWQSDTGLAWNQLIGAVPTPVVESANIFHHEVRFGEVLIGAIPSVTSYSSNPRRSLIHSFDGGLEWKSSTYRHGAFDLKVDAMAFAVGETAVVGLMNLNSVIRSEDGVDWSPITNLPPLKWSAPLRKDGHIALVSQDGRYFYSLDDGLTWDERTSIEDVTLIPRHVLGGKFYTLTKNPHLSFYRSDDGFVWENLPLPTQNLGRLFDDGTDLFFIGDPGLYRFRSNDNSWEMLTPSLPRDQVPTEISKVGDFFFSARHMNTGSGVWKDINLDGAPSGTLSAIDQINGLYVGYSGSFLFSSTDGIYWTRRQGFGAPNAGRDQAAKFFERVGDRLRIRDLFYQLWETADGLTWNAISYGVSAPRPLRRIKKMVEFEGRFFAADSSGGLITSVDGTAWEHLALEDYFLTSRGRVIDLVGSDTQLYAIINTGMSFESGEGRQVYVTEDGIRWQRIAALAGYDIQTMAIQGNVVMAAGIADERVLFLRSGDSGIQWTEYSPPNLESTYVGSLFFDYGRWACVIDSFDNTGRRLIASSQDGLVWTRHGLLPPDVELTVEILQAHGKTLAWAPLRSGKVYQVTSQFQLTTFGQGTTYNGVSQVFPTNEGFGRVEGTSTVRLSKISKNGVAWVEASGEFNYAERVFYLDGRLFGSRSDATIFEISNFDAAIEVDFPGGLTDVRVADTITITGRVRNRGAETIPAGDYFVEAWLSNDGQIGNYDDTLLGGKVFSISELGLGQSGIFNTSVVVPNKISPGEKRLIVRIQLLGKIDRSNFNNLSISPSAIYNLPAMSLDLTTVGEGYVDSDSFGSYFAQGSIISLNAIPTKGARFAGWSGDAAGALDEVSILMDADKTIAALFEDVAILRARTIGSGRIEGLRADGNYLPGELLNLRPLADQGWEFLEWQGDLAGAPAEAQLVMNSAKSVTAVFQKTFESWRVNSFTVDQLADPRISGSEGDPDHDGLPNWIEYLHGSNPLKREETGIIKSQLENGAYVVIYTRLINPEAGISLELQASRDLRNAVAAGFQERILTTVDGVQTVEASLTTTEGRGFIKFVYRRNQ